MGELPFLLLVMMDWLVVAEAWIKVKREVMKLWTLARSLYLRQSRKAVVNSNALHIHGES
jgi:hypothetical protein